MGEWLTVLSGFLFALHIIVTDGVTRVVDPIQSTGTMMVTVMLLAFLILLADPMGYEGSSPLGDSLALLIHFDYLLPLSLCGFFGSFTALALLMRYQKGSLPVRAALVYALSQCGLRSSAWVWGWRRSTLWLFIGAGSLLLDDSNCMS